MTVEQDIARWDGKSADAIRQIYDRHASSSSFVPDILELMQQESLQNGATWLLKRHVENTGCPDPSAVAVIYAALPLLAHWETKLHILQVIPSLPIPEAHRPAVETFLRECLVSDAKFVRAWAYGGFYELAARHPQYQEEAGQIFEVAMGEEPASVRARVRKVMSKGF